MAISDKLNYLIETKSQLKDMINYGLDDDNKITSSTTYRNYVTSVFKAFLESLNNPDTLFTNLPKKTGTGSNITLNDTANAPMRITLSPTELSQSGTPTPSSPQDIHTISGDNKLGVNGKNLLPYPYADTTRVINGVTFTDNGDGSITLNGTSTATCNFRLMAQSQYFPNGTYTFTLKNGNGSNCYIYRGGMAISGLAGSGYVTKTDTLTQNTYGDFLIQVPKDRTFNNFTVTPLLVKGSYTADTIGDYEPYISQTAEVNLGYENMLNIADRSGTSGGITYVIKNGVITFNGTATGNGSLYIDVKKTFTENAYFSKETEGTGTGINNPMSWTRDATTKYTYNNQFQSGDYLNTYYFTWASGAVADNYVVKPMLVKGTTAHNFTEYGKAIEYSKMPNTNYTDEFIRTSGKNLFDKDNADVVTGYGDGTGNVVLGGTSKITRAYIPIIPNTNMNISGFSNIILFFYSKDKTFIERVLTGASSYTFNKNAYYIRIQGTGENFNADAIMLNEGTTALPYEPYGLNKWYIKKNIGKVVLDGTESWALGNTNTRRTTYYIEIADKENYTSSSSIPNLLSNYFRSVSENSTWTNGDMSCETNYPKRITLCMNPTSYTTLSDFTTWIGSNNVSIYYAMATPTYIPITGTLAEQLENVYQLLKSYKGVTNISQVNNDLPFELNVEAVEDIE